MEDAPETLRIAYLNSILERLTYLTESENDDGRPFRAYTLIQRYCALMPMEMPSFPPNTTAWDDLKDLVKGAEWFNFYDFVEYVGKQMRVEQRDVQSQLWLARFGFDQYRRQLNELFAEDRIGWKLNESTELVREIPKSLAERLDSTSARLVDEFEPARGHYLKAIRYVSTRDLDAENAIKEITSAVESVGRVFYPKALTLGDVSKEMKQKGLWPPALVAMIEKFYGYASSEPAVRHGGPVSSRVKLDDAEFCLHVGVALIRYIMEKHDSQKKNPTGPI